MWPFKVDAGSDGKQLIYTNDGLTHILYSLKVLRTKLFIVY